MKGLGAIIGFGTIGNLISRTDFHRNIIGDAHGGFLLLVVVYGCALFFRETAFGVILWVVSVIVLFTLYPLILKRVRETQE